MLTFTTCKPCENNHGKIFPIQADVKGQIPAHIFCKCRMEPVRTVKAGKATYSGIFGADVFLSLFGRLPDNYINKKVARKSGWKDYKGNLSEVLPGKRIGGDVYRNANEKLPDSENRIWYEADINYSSGYRNKARILYSNDGLIFVTYDHYTTFYEIT